MPKTCASCGTTYPDEMVFCPTDGISLRSDDAGGDLIGTVIADRYLVSALLGEGGMGKVYLASHVRLPQKAAIKVLHHDMVKDAGAVARFNREAANAARIEHERVARVFDFGETSEGLVYLAMEFVPGVTLRDLLNDERRLPAARAANMIYQVAEGLDAAHRLSIVHRDLKPDNILVVTDEGGVDRCKVVDFGIAKVTNSSETQLTQAGMLVGTPEFMSPEQVLGEQLDGRSDVYALALVAYEVFSGELPFEGNTPERKLTARLIQDPRPLAETAPDVDWPDALQAAFDGALVREPEGRTATAMEFAEQLVSAVEGWTGMSVLRARTPMSTTAITAAANESTGNMTRPLQGTPASTTAVMTPAAGKTSAAGKTPAAATSVRSATPGAGTSASKQAIPEPVPKKTPWILYAAVVAISVAGGAYVAFGRDRTPPVVADAPVTGAPVASAGGGEGAPSSAPVQPAPTNSGTGAASASPEPATPAVRAPSPATTPSNTAVAAPPSGASTTVPTAATGGVTAAQAADARLALSVIQTALKNAPDGQEAAVALRNIPQLLQLLPHIGTGTDSTWAYLALVSAYGMAEQQDRACVPLRNASRLASTSEQRTAVAQFRNLLTCAP